MVLGIGMVISACSTDTTATAVSSNTPSVDTSATVTPTDTPATRAPTRPPTQIVTVTPHIYCDDVPETYLIIAERGRVTRTDGDETLNLRSGPGTDYEILVQIDPLEMFYVVDGVQCSGGYAWFQVNYRGRVGWIAEGDEDQYYAEPYQTG